MAPNKDKTVWINPYKQKLWPVKLVDDYIPPKTFMETRPNRYLQPAVLLGKRIYIWVAENQLKEYDPSHDYIDGKQFENNDISRADSEEEALEKYRRIAFTIDARNPQTGVFYKNFIEQRSGIRKLEHGIVPKPVTRKRSRDADEDDDIEIIEVRSRSSAVAGSPKRRRESVEYHSAKKAKYLPTPESIAKKRTTPTKPKKAPEDSDDELFVRQTKSESDPFISSLESSYDEIRGKNREKVRELAPADDLCTIFVGSEQTPFLVRKDKVGECDFLANQVVFNEELKSHIELADDIHVQPKDFRPIRKYMNEGEFAPRLIESPSRGLRRLEKVALQEEKDEAAQFIAQVYLTAVKIQFAPVQQLCVQKLKVLYPLSLHTLLVVLMIFMQAEKYGCGTDSEGKEWLVDHVVEYYKPLKRNEGRTFSRLMEPESEMRRLIEQRRTENPQMCLSAD